MKLKQNEIIDFTNREITIIRLSKDNFTCKEIANEANCTLLELDQTLWHRNSVGK